MANVNVKEQNVETINKGEEFLLKNKKTIMYAVIALVVIIAGIILYNNFVKTPREAEASTELAKGQDLFNNQQFDKALNGDGATYAGFAKIASDYSSTAAGNLANLYAGLCYANLGKWQEAVNFLDKYSPADDEMVSPAAVAALGNAYAHVKEIDKAVANLKKAAKMADIKKKYVNSPISQEIDKYIERASAQ